MFDLGGVPGFDALSVHDFAVLRRAVDNVRARNGAGPTTPPPGVRVEV